MDVNRGRNLEKRKRRSWKRKRLGGRWGLLGCRTPGCEVGAGVQALGDRASENPERETWCKGGRGGSCRSPEDGGMRPGEAAQSCRGDVVAVAAAAAAGGDGDGLGLGGGQWTGPQRKERRGQDGHCCWLKGGHTGEGEEVPGSTQPGMGEKAECTWVADWQQRGLWEGGRSGGNWAVPGRPGTGRQSWNWRRLPRSCWRRRSKSTSLGGRGRRRRTQGAEGGAREPGPGPSLGQEEVHPYSGPWRGGRAGAQVAAEPPGQEEKLMHC